MNELDELNFLIVNYLNYPERFIIYQTYPFLRYRKIHQFQILTNEYFYASEKFMDKICVLAINNTDFNNKIIKYKSSSNSVRKLIISDNNFNLPSHLNYLSTNQNLPKLSKLLLRELTIDADIKQPIEYPSTLHKLTINGSFKVDNLPVKLRYLYLRERFNQPIDNLPINLKCLEIGSNFDHSVNHLPPNLIKLSFSEKFNQSVENLPENLQKLKFGYQFNRSVDNLPKNLTHLIFVGKFNQSVDKLPHGLLVLKIELSDGNFKQSLDNLPPKLKLFRFDTGRCAYTLDKLPLSLKYLSLNMAPDSHLSLNYLINLKKLTFEHPWLHFSTLPDNLERVNGYKPNQFNDSLPQTVKYIIFERHFDSNVDFLSNLPLEYIDFGYQFNQSVDKLPEGLKILKFGCLFNQLVNNLPISLKKIVLGEMFNQPIETLCERNINLRSITFGTNFSQSSNSLRNTNIKKVFTYSKLNVLPKKVIKAIFYSSAHQMLHMEIPSTLKCINVCECQFNNIPKTVKYVSLMIHTLNFR